MPLESKIEQLRPLAEEFLEGHLYLKSYLKNASLQEALVIYSLIAIGQGEAFFKGEEFFRRHCENFNAAVKKLIEVESFYSCIGGIVGYHNAISELLAGTEGLRPGYKAALPPCHDLREDSTKEKFFIRKGIEAFNTLAEIYVVGGAAERLAWVSEGTSLPAALLPFLGRTLLEGLVRDLQAREYLNYKLTGRVVILPLVLMTSQEKNVHKHILELCRRHRWYGRDEKDWHFICQPLVPLVDSEGRWCLTGPFELQWRPGGHGVLWKLMREHSIFDMLLKKGCSGALVRQINNPLGDIDGGLLALAGAATAMRKTMGFLACPRRPGASEGVDVLLTIPAENDEVRYAITNIEYTALKGSPLENVDFPANTNLLYVDLKGVEAASVLCPLPGMLINMKSAVEGYLPAGRLETTMQNIADHIATRPIQPHVPLDEKELPSLVILRDRIKTLAVTKRLKGESFDETPDGAFYALLKNYEALLKDYCRMDVPTVGTPEEYLSGRWGFLAYLHPALGPLFSIIGQKIRSGTIAPGAFLELEIAEVDIHDLNLSGSLRIICEEVFGSDDQGRVQYSRGGGRCTLERVTIKNEGVDRAQPSIPWMRACQHKEAITILIHGDGEFYAQDIELHGSHYFEVPAGKRLTLQQSQGMITQTLTDLSAPSWQWRYSFNDANEVILRQVARPR